MFIGRQFKNSKSEYDKKMNDDPILLAYLMVASDKLFSDDEFPIQNLIAEKVDKVFNLVEIDKSEIENLLVKRARIIFYYKPSYIQKNTKAGLGYKKKQNQNKKSESQNFRKRRALFMEQVLNKRNKSDLVDRLMRNSMLRKRNNNMPKMFQRNNVLNVNKLDMLAANVQTWSLLMLKRIKRNLMLKNRRHPNLSQNKFGNKRLICQNQTKFGNQKLVCQNKTFKMIQDFIKRMF
ncbi:hypothetical protein Hanom_Chr15g01373361 [Helianthus anomalus]